MADYQFNTDLGPKGQQGTSLGDLINTARGVQAYQQSQEANPLAIERARLELQQAQQMNPLAAQRARMEIEQRQKLNPLEAEKAAMEVEQLKKTNPLAVREKTAQAGMAELGLSSAQNDKLYGLAAGVLNDPRLKSDNPSEVMGALYEAKQRGSTFGLPNQIVDGVFNPLFQLAKDKPTAVKQSLTNIVQSRVPAEVQNAMQIGGVVKINGVDYQYSAANGRLEEIGAKPAPKPVADETKKSSAEQTKPTTGLVPIDAPVSGLQMNTQQTERYNMGQKDFENANERQVISKDSALAAQQIKKTLREAAGSKPTQIVRQAGQAFFGNPELDTLVKNLAEQQIRQAKLMGLKSVSAEDDLKKANGSENITAEALAHIVDRAEAMNLAADKYNQALTKMQAKYGKQNAYIHNDNFQRAWSNNYDPVAFLVQNINASNIPKKEKETAIDYYTSGMSQKQLDDLAVKMKNLKRLERGDF